VCNQTYTNYEVIIVDSSTTNLSKNIILEYMAVHPQIRYIFEQKKIRGFARNISVQAASGDILVTTDSDCIVPHDWIENITKPIREEGEKAVQGFESDLIGNYWTKHVQEADWCFLKERTEGNYIHIIDTKNFAISADILKKYLFDPLIHHGEDSELYLRIKEVYKIRFCPDIRLGHTHPSTFKAVVKKNVDRASEYEKRMKSHPRELSEDKMMLKNMKLRSIIPFLLWTPLQFLRRSPGDAFFVIVSDAAWRWGLLRKS